MTFWFCIPEKHIYSLKEDTSFSERTRDVYLVTDSFGGNFNCDVAGPLSYLYLLELKEATLYVSRDGQQLYSKISFFKAFRQLQFTVTFDIPSAPPPPLIQWKRYQRWVFLLGRDFQLCRKIWGHEIRVRWLLYDVERNHMIYHVNVSSLLSEHNLHMKKMIDNLIRMKCWIHSHTCTRSMGADPASK